MHAKALIGIVRSRTAYIRDWLKVIPEMERDCVAAEGLRERVFDLSSVLDGDADREVLTDFAVLGRNLPFPLIAIVGSGHGVFIVRADEEGNGFYCYCYTSPVEILVVRFTPTGWEYEGFTREPGTGPQLVAASDPRVKRFADGVATLLAVVESACANTRNVVSYSLSRAERRRAVRDAGADMHALDNTVVHRVCLDAREKRAVSQSRGPLVVSTPKRLHEVRAHWRHLKSGEVVRVRSHRRGQHGALLPRVYSVSDESSSLARRGHP